MGGLHEIKGRCHCGNIEYLFRSPVPMMELPVKSCDCSFCIKQGACYVSHPQGRLEVLVKDRSRVSQYRFGTESAEVYICSTCGVFPFIVGTIAGQLYAVLNANSINGLHIEHAKIVPAEHVDNRTAEERSERWKKNWIPKVEITYLKQAVNPAFL